jgi:hypothetical protein
VQSLEFQTCSLVSHIFEIGSRKLSKYFKVCLFLDTIIKISELLLESYEMNK